MKEKIKAYLGSDPYIFVSYAHKDFETISPFIVALQEHYNVWFDEGLTPGERYDEEIIAKIEACSVFLYLITEESLTSEYCKKEVRFANKKKKPFINVLVTEVKLPSWFEFEDLDSYQYLSLFKFSTAKEAVKDLKRKNDALKATERAAENSEFLFRSNGNGSCTVVGINDLTVKKISIPVVSPAGEHVTAIGADAFARCTELISIILPDEIVSIGERAFQGCSKLTSILLPKQLRLIGNSAFKSCLELTSIPLPKQLEFIGNAAFMACSKLKNISIPDSVTDIGDSVFVGCESLTSIKIPDRVETIGDNVFLACRLTSITVSSGNKDYHSVGNCLIETESKKLIWGCNNSVIPEDGSVTSIGGHAFSGCSELMNITIPNSVSSIGECAFLCCGFTNITIPDSVTDIGQGAFMGCYALTGIVIPDRVSRIGSFVFSNCPALTSIAVTSGNAYYHSNGNCLIETASKSLIVGCKASVIPTDGSVTSIGVFAFERCRDLTSITIPDSITNIGECAFTHCTNLTSVIYNGTQAQWNAIDKGTDWDDGIDSYTIHCTDGDIAKE